MKKYLVFMLVVLFALASTMNAQEKKDKKAKGPSIEMRVEKMATDLGLSDVEKVAVKALLEKQDAEKKELMSGADKENPEFKQKAKDLNKKHGADLKTTLGEEKFKKLMEIRAAERQGDKKP